MPRNSATSSHQLPTFCYNTKMQKLYCYVDESGQDTRGRLFVVAVVLVSDKEATFQLCEQFERESGKGKFKWGKAENKARLEYLRRVFETESFKDSLCYAIFKQTRDYETSTIEAIARAISWKAAGESYRVSVYVDGLSKNKRQPYGSELRKLGVSIHKIQGVTKEENNALTRLADALAGFIRDAVDEHGDDIQKLYQLAISRGYIKEI
jgi:hypothetical protein